MTRACRIPRSGSACPPSAGTLTDDEIDTIVEYLKTLP